MKERDKATVTDLQVFHGTKWAVFLFSRVLICTTAKKDKHRLRRSNVEDDSKKPG